MSKIFERNEIGLVPSSGTGGVGPAGPANELTVGTVETLAPGEDATVVITGESPKQVINFGIPQGEKGDPGDAAAVTVPALGGVGDSSLKHYTNSDGTGVVSAGQKVAGSTLRWVSLFAPDFGTLSGVIQVNGSPSHAGTWRLSGPVVAAADAPGLVLTATRVDDVRVIARSSEGIANIRNLTQSGTEEAPSVDCEILLGEEWVPFTASPDDPEAHGRIIYANALAGTYGAVLTPETK